MSDARKVSHHRDGDLSDAAARNLLGGLTPQEHARSAPLREAMLAHASDMGPPSRRRLQIARPLTVVALAGAALLVLGGLQVWYSQVGRSTLSVEGATQVHQGGAGPQSEAALNGLLAPQTAWAAIDGCVIEFEQIALGRRNPRYSQEGARNEDFYRTVEAFAAKHGELDVPDGGLPVAHIDLGSSSDYGWWRPNRYRVILLSADTALRDELIDELEKLPGLWGPKIFSQQLYFSEKYPAIYTPERRIVVDGREFQFPQGIDSCALQNLIREFELSPNVISFRAFWLPGEHFYTTTMANPFGVGQISRVELNEKGDLIITTLMEQVDFDIPDALRTNWWQKGERSIAMIQLNKRRDEVGADFDPIAAIKAKIEEKVHPPVIDQTDLPAINDYYFIVVPEELWDGDLDATISAEAIARYDAVVQQARASSDRYISDHQSQLQGMHPIRFAPMRVGEVVPVIYARIITDDAGLAAGYRSALAAVPGIVTSYEDVIPAEDFAK